LCLHLVAIRNGHFPHVITKPAKLPALPIVPTCRRPDPNTESLLNIFILPMTNDHFSIQSHSRHDETKFPIAVRTLIQVHEIHVNVFPWNVPVELCVEMNEGFVYYF